jgi:hypothetical protein
VRDLKKGIGLTKNFFKNLIYLHPDGHVYDHDEDYALILISQLLSSKYEGYPLHILHLGPPGCGKTMYLECLDSKFQEDSAILESGNGTIKALIPSFKESPASPGYILRCVRYGLVDELMKMIENIGLHAGIGQLQRQYLGQLNVLLEQKKRTIGSGNNNSFLVKSTAKIMIATNPLKGKRDVGMHLSIIDESTLSRFLVVVQDEKEQRYIKSNKPKTLYEAFFKDIFKTLDQNKNLKTSSPKYENLKTSSPNDNDLKTSAQVGHQTLSNPNEKKEEYIGKYVSGGDSNDFTQEKSENLKTSSQKRLKITHEIEKVRHQKDPYPRPIIGHQIPSGFRNFNKEVLIRQGQVTKIDEENFLDEIRNIFLTIYDSCQEFLVEFDYDKIENIFRKALSQTPGILQRMWLARGRHHLVLLLDGIVKYRCLFDSSDATFTPIDKDYEVLEKLILRIIKGWSVNLDVGDWQDIMNPDESE